MGPMHLSLLHKVHLSYGRVILSYEVLFWQISLPSALFSFPFSFNLTLYLLSPYVLNNSTFHENFSFLSLIHILSLYCHPWPWTHIHFNFYLYYILRITCLNFKIHNLTGKGHLLSQPGYWGNKFFVSAYDDILKIKKSHMYSSSISNLRRNLPWHIYEACLANSKCASWANKITWEFVKNEESWSPFQAY